MNNKHEFHCVELIPTSATEEFLSYLNPDAGHWGTDLESSWVFRGQADATWGLVPSAFRRESDSWLKPLMTDLKPVIENDWYNGYDHLTKDYGKEHTIDVLARTAAVFQLTDNFVKLADELGYPVPGMDTICSGPYIIREHQWPGNGHLHHLFSKAFTVAQHHGLPTHLLDWTRKPFVAAFFAADSSIDLDSSEPHDIAVWAFNLNHIDESWSYTLRKLTCPRSEHGFLHAQDALFLLYAWADEFCLKEGCWPDFIEVIEKHYKEGQPKPLCKITLNGRKVPSLYRNLLRWRISKAVLMPTFDNIVDTLRRKNLILQIEL